eukprot:6088924-Pyramimonas_sp.AAC.1
MRLYAGLPALPTHCVLEANASRHACIICGCTQAETEAGQLLIGDNRGSRVRLCRNFSLAAGLCP